MSLETVQCKSLADIASIILKNSDKETYINICPGDIGVDTPIKLFFFLVGILNESLNILCNSEILLSHLEIFQEKLEPAGFKMNIRIEKNNHFQNKILMGHMCENNGENLLDFKLIAIFPGNTYIINFDYVTKWKDTAICKKPYLRLI